MKSLFTDEDVLKFLESGNKLSQNELIDILDGIGFHKEESRNKTLLKHSDIEEVILFYKKNYNDSSQKQTGITIRVLREAIAKRHGDNHYEEDRESDEFLSKMGIPPPNRKTLLETINEESKTTEKDAIQAVLDKKPNPNKRGKRRELRKERIIKSEDYKSRLDNSKKK